MHNDIFSIGNLTIHGYGLMIAIGMILAFYMADKRAPKYNIKSDNVWTIGVLIVVFGFMCSKLLYFITIWQDILKDPKELLSLDGGFVVYGGLIGGGLTAYIYCKVTKGVFLDYIDLAVPSVALAQGIGRIGCLLAGCCYGRETDSWFHIVFHDSQLAPNGIKLVPTQIIMSVADLILCVILLLAAKKYKKRGQVTGIYIILYSIGRFIIEYWRGDIARGSVGVLSTSQFISIFTLIVGIVVLVVARNNKEPLKDKGIADTSK